MPHFQFLDTYTAEELRLAYDIGSRISRRTHFSQVNEFKML